MSIPSNTSLKEFFNYYVQDQNILDKIHEYDDEIESLNNSLESERKRNELLSEQNMFMEEFITFVLKKCKESGSKKDLVKEIQIAFENSYIEI